MSQFTFISIMQNLNHPLSVMAVEKLARLTAHFQEHERSQSDNEYDPVHAPALMQPLLLPAVFDPKLFGDAMFFDLLKGMAQDPEHAINGLVRVYIEGMLSPEHENAVLYEKPLVDEGFATFLKRVCDGRPFGLVINGAEQWSEPLARLAGKLFAPILDAQGLSCSTLEVTLFIGDYGYTPFGIHIDDPYTSVVHFHVGPGMKEMTLFGREEFHRLNGERKNCFQPKRILAHGKTWAIQAGDVFVLPPHYYHIGDTKGFSIGVAIAVSKYTKQNISKQIVNKASNAEQFAKNFEEILQEQRQHQQTVHDWLQLAHLEFYAKKNSQVSLRYGWRRKPEYELNWQENFITDPDFPLACLHLEKDIILFARGNRLRLANNELTTELAQALQAKEFTLEQLHTSLQGKISYSALQVILKKMYEFGYLHPQTINAEVAS
ncbi:hypothetical protein V8J88_13770 [Massilia sp. W12]|uniref:hypothetical protein n=1 Tax=Massilia sp. W12 TaxID=3126507 RepID=UPI0030D30302